MYLFEKPCEKTPDEFMLKYATKQIRKATRTKDYIAVRQWKKLKRNTSERLTEQDKVYLTGRY